jgi:hypothetical protein
VLGDDDAYDEFVVDVYYDTRYGSFIFDTIAGASSCPHEPNTQPNLDPKMKVFTRSSSIVFPRDEMVFDVEISNTGADLNPDGNDFSLVSSQGKGNLQVRVDGTTLTEGGLILNLKHDTIVYKQVTIKRGPRLFKNEAIELKLQTMCG